MSASIPMGISIAAKAGGANDAISNKMCAVGAYAVMGGK